MDAIDKFKGCIYGLAIGDALGYPVEFMNLESIKEIYGEKGITGFDSFRKIGREVGFYSDDTQMTLATAKGIIDSKLQPDNLDEIMSNIAKEYIAWGNSPENNRAPGNTCMAGVRNLGKGIHWKLSGINGEGCGAAMRTAPIGLYAGKDEKLLIPLTLAASRCTHANSTAATSGLATAYIVNAALENISLDFIKFSAESLSGFGDFKYKNKIKQALNLLKSNITDSEALAQLGEGWTGHEAVAMALYCFLRSPQNYRQTVLRAANITGDSDSVACIAGAISGAYNGIQAIPSEWIAVIENRELLGKTAEQLYQKATTRIPLERAPNIL